MVMTQVSTNLAFASNRSLVWIFSVCDKCMCVFMILKDLFFALLNPVHLSLTETQMYQYESAYDMTVSNLCVASAEMAMIACGSHS